MQIVTLTANPAIDVNTEVDRVISDAKLRCSNVTYEAGGGGINVSRAIQRLGGETLAVYTAGGPTGDLLEMLVSDDGIRGMRIAVEEWTRQNLTASENSSGDQYRFVLPGPNLKLKEWRRCLDEIDSLPDAPEYLVASGSLPPGAPEDFYARLARWANEAGVKMILDTKGEALRLAAAEGVYLLKPNMRELSHLAGRELQDDADVDAVAAEYVKKGCCHSLALSLGKAGAVLYTTDHCVYIPAPTVQIRSTVGAGDSMVAGIVLSLARGASIEEATRFGVAAGAAAAMTPGTELCRREDTKRLYRQMFRPLEKSSEPK